MCADIFKRNVFLEHCKFSRERFNIIQCVDNVDLNEILEVGLLKYSDVIAQQYNVL